MDNFSGKWSRAAGGKTARLVVVLLVLGDASDGDGDVSVSSTGSQVKSQSRVQSAHCPVSCEKCVCECACVSGLCVCVCCPKDFYACHMAAVLHSDILTSPALAAARVCPRPARRSSSRSSSQTARGQKYHLSD